MFRSNGRWYARTLAAALILCARTTLRHADAQTTRKPLSKVDVVELLAGDVSSNRIEALARQYGINFELTPAIEGELRQAGATDELVATLRELAPKPPAPPVLEIQSAPGHAEVYIDDARAGQTSEEGRLKVPNLTPGSHRLRLAYDGYHDSERQVDLVAGQTQSVTVNLEKLPAPSVTLIPEVITIEKGQSVTLAWMSENATELDLEPGVGTVEPKGSRTLAPLDSTSYTLTAKGPGGTASAKASITVKLPPASPQPPPSPVESPAMKTLSAAPTSYQVFHWHGPVGGCAGTLTITSASVEYRTTANNGHTFSIPLSNIKDVKLDFGLFRSFGQAMAGTLDFKIYLKQGRPILFTADKKSDVVEALQLAVRRYSESPTR